MALFSRFRNTLTTPPTRSQQATAGTDLTFANATRSFIPLNTGAITVRLQDDSTDRTFEVLQGAQYSMRVSHFRAGSTASIVGLW